MDRQEAWLALETTIMKTIQYAIQALILTEKECKYVMAPIWEISLPKSAIFMNFPKNVLFGLIEEGGMGKWDIF